MRTRKLIVENGVVTALDLEGPPIEADYFLTGICASEHQTLELDKRPHPDRALLDIGIELAPSRCRAFGIEIPPFKNRRCCRSSSNLGAFAFAMDRSLPASRPFGIAGQASPMDLRFSSDTADWFDGDPQATAHSSAAAPKSNAALAAASWRPE